MKKTSIQLAALLCALSLPALAADPVTVAKVDAKPKAQVPAAKPKAPAPAPAAKTDPNAKKAASKPVTVAKADAKPKPNAAKKAAPAPKKEVAAATPAPVPPKPAPAPRVWPKPDPQASQKIDALLAKEWKNAGIEPNKPVSDEVFLRRIYLDLIGRIPTHKEALAFLASKESDKRAKLIDTLLASEGYVNHFYNYWADILRINTGMPAGQNIVPFYIDWVRDSLGENKPYDVFVRELLTADGQAWDNGAVGYYVRDRGMPLDNMSNTVRIFLGTRLECAQCHDHPFDSWTQMDFYHMAAFTYGVNPSGSRYGSINEATQMIRQAADMSDDRKSELRQALTEVTRPIRNNYLVSFRNALPKLPHDYKYDNGKPNETIAPGTMFGEKLEDLKPDDRLKAYAEWMTSPENPLFTTVIANRLWKRAFGVGVYEPVDEFTEESEPSNAELMAFLESQMVANRYDMKAFLRVVFNTQAYQRAATESDLEPGEIYHFPGPVLRRMSAEQIWDSTVALVNDTPEIGDWKREQTFALRMAEQEAMQEVLQCCTEEELVEHAKAIAKVQNDLKLEDARIRKEIDAATAANDKKKAQELSRELSRIRNQLTAKIREDIYKPALAKAKPDNLSMDLPNGACIEINPMSMDGDGMTSAELRKLQDAAEKKLIDDEMNALGMTDPKERKSFEGYRRGSIRMVRAAHVGSPAPLGHFLREFGQSDRDTIENANSDASVPQALQLLNGGTFGQVSSGYSVLNRTLREAKTPEEKLDALYLSVLTRKPTEKERRAILSHARERGGNLFTDVTFALLNNQEFWFVQ